MSKYSPEMCKIASDYIGSGHSVEALAAELKVSRETIYTWRNSEKEGYHPEFALALEDGYNRRNALLESELHQLALTGKGNASALIFMCKNFCGMRDDFGVDHTTNGKDLPVPILQYVPIDDRNKKDNGNEKPA